MRGGSKVSAGLGDPPHSPGETPGGPRRGRLSLGNELRDMYRQDGNRKGQERISPQPLRKMQSKIYKRALSLVCFFRETGALSTAWLLALPHHSHVHWGVGVAVEGKEKTVMYLEFSKTKGIEKKPKKSVTVLETQGSGNRQQPHHHLHPLPSSVQT